MKHIMCSTDLTVIDEYPCKDYYTSENTVLIKDAIMKTYYCNFCKIMVKKIHTIVQNP